MTDQLAPGGVDDAVDMADAVGAADDRSDVDQLRGDGNETGIATPSAPRRSRRVSRWDRPPEPHDWRFFVGTLGRILIVTGLLLFGFVAYQLWGTGIETARAQNRLESEFDQILADAGIQVDESPAAGGPADPTPDTSGSASVDSPPGDGVVDEEVNGSTDGSVDGEPSIGVGPVTSAIPVAVDLSDQAVRQEPIPQPFRGDPLMRLEIPAIGRDDIVVPGVTLDDLKAGPGHYPDTPLPGQLGNASIAGHRTTYGAPFFDVDQLGPGDEIITTLLNGDRFVYEVTFVEIVSAADYQVVTTTDPNIAELTLTSCHPKYTARDRIVVHSVLNPNKSSQVGVPTFYVLEPAPDDRSGDGVIAGDDPVVGVGDIDITEPDSALAEPGDEGAEGAEPIESSSDGEATGVGDAGNGEGNGDTEPRPVTAQELAEAQQAAAAAEPVDAFSQGWFDDRAAFPQIALWALALVIISILSYQISKRFRNLALGMLAGAVPFVVALYFFYQNVNRLLPPGI